MQGTDLPVFYVTNRGAVIEKPEPIHTLLPSERLHGSLLVPRNQFVGAGRQGAIGRRRTDMPSVPTSEGRTRIRYCAR